MADPIISVLQELKAKAERNHNRYAVVFSGESRWCYTRARRTAALFSESQCLWITKQANFSTQKPAASGVRRYLGMEFQAVIFDAYSGFDPDLFAAVCGTIKGGGLLILLCPALDQWEDFNDPEKSRLAIWPYTAAHVSGRFLRLTAQALEQDKNTIIIAQNKDLPHDRLAALPDPGTKYESLQDYFPCRSEDQQRAVHAILHVVSGHRHRPLVVTSDRGRGKSAALGIAAAQLLKKGVNKIIITAPGLEAVTPVFERAQSLIPAAHFEKGQLRLGDASVIFVAADELVRRHVECNLLLVDEAAAIPTVLLEHYLKTYARIVFSTTVHGYEGTGRGFALRFNEFLDKYTPGWQALQLDTPIRWVKQDPLEALVFKALMLDAQPAPDGVADGACIDNCRFEKLDRDALLEDVNSLRQLFALLVLAHYQTQPADLRYLLDGRDVHIYVLRRDNHIIAAALLEEEGAFDKGLAEKVYGNQRRVRGHLLAQSLAAYVGLSDAPLLKYARVMRIAVHPLAQRHGLGAWLLKKIESNLIQGEFDLWGASFSAEADLVRFWIKAEFAPVYLGLSRHAASGMPSAMLLKAQSDQGRDLLTRAGQKFERHFSFMLAEVYNDLDPLLVRALIETRHGEPLLTISLEDWQDINSFVNLARGYEVNSVALWKLVGNSLREGTDIHSLTPLEYALLVTKVMQKKTWTEVVTAMGFTGQKHALQSLRQAVRKLLNGRRVNGNVVQTKS